MVGCAYSEQTLFWTIQLCPLCHSQPKLQSVLSPRMNQRFAPNIARPNGWSIWISIECCECFYYSEKSWSGWFVLNCALCVSGRADGRTTYAANGNLYSLHAFSESSRSASKLNPAYYKARYWQERRESILAERKQAANHTTKRILLMLKPACKQFVMTSWSEHGSMDTSFNQKLKSAWSHVDANGSTLIYLHEFHEVDIVYAADLHDLCAQTANSIPWRHKVI